MEPNVMNATMAKTYMTEEFPEALGDRHAARGAYQLRGAAWTHGVLAVPPRPVRTAEKRLINGWGAGAHP